MRKISFKFILSQKFQASWHLEFSHSKQKILKFYHLHCNNKRFYISQTIRSRYFILLITAKFRLRQNISIYHHIWALIMRKPVHSVYHSNLSGEKIFHFFITEKLCLREYISMFLNTANLNMLRENISASRCKTAPRTKTSLRKNSVKPF